MVMAIAAPAKANHGETKNDPAKKAKINPANVPSQVFPLLKGSEVEINPPKSEAALSPKQNIAIAAPPALIGKSSNVATIPANKVVLQQNHTVPTVKPHDVL